MLSGQAQNGWIKNNILECHQERRVPTRESLNNVSILYRFNEKANLEIAQALYIYQFKFNSNTRKNSVIVR